MVHIVQTIVSHLIQFGDRPLHKQHDSESSLWQTTSYSHYLAEIEKCAAYWKDRLQSLGITAYQGSVVGLWLTGDSFFDTVHMYALMALGYVPQMFNAYHTNLGQTAIQQLLAACGGKCLIHHPDFLTSDLDLPSLEAPPLDAFKDIIASSFQTPQALPEDVAIIFHSSGTTGSLPKPIRISHKWLHSLIHHLWPSVWIRAAQGESQASMTPIGSYGNVGAGMGVACTIAQGWCFVQPLKTPMDGDTFIEMVNGAGLNNLLMYSPWLARLFGIAKSQPKVVEALKKMRQIVWTGASLHDQAGLWAIGQGLPLRGMYATTEGAMALAADMDNPQSFPAMRLLPASKARLIPNSGGIVTSEGPVPNETGDGGETSQVKPLLDLFLPIEADTCPLPPIRNRPDGHISGDLFEETSPGYYIFRGRADDWIRTGPKLHFCDTKAIEDGVLNSCKDLVSNCVVIGHNKPALVLFVEPVDSLQLSDQEAVNRLKTEVYQRMEGFNKTHLPHERIFGTSYIVVVSAGHLARTKEKGNVRRRVVEKDFADVLDEIYSKIRVWNA